MDELQLKMITDLALCNADVYGYLKYGKYGLSNEQVDKIMNFIKRRYSDYLIILCNDIAEDLVNKLQNPPL
jgi:hypothetical protein